MTTLWVATTRHHHTERVLLVRKGCTRSRGKYLRPTGWEVQGIRMASNCIEMWIIICSCRTLENMGTLTIIINCKCPWALQAAPHNYQVKPPASIVLHLTLPKLHLATFKVVRFVTLFVRCNSFEGRLDQPEALVMEMFGSDVKVCGQLLRRVFF